MSRKRRAVAALGLLLGSATSGEAAVSPQDGFSPIGAPEWHFNIAPYLWLPSTSAEIVLGNGAQVDIDKGAPTLSELFNVLQGAFLGASLVRYGRWSGALDIQHISVSQNTGLPALIPGVTRNLDLDVSLVRVAPGIGYQLYNGTMGSSPATLDGRVGFSWLQTSESLKLSQTSPAGNTRISDLSASNGFVQPWVGLEERSIHRSGGGWSWESWSRDSASATGRGAGAHQPWRPGPQMTGSISYLDTVRSTPSARDPNRP